MNIKSQATIYYAYDLDGTSFKNVATSNTLTTPLKVASLFAKKIANTSYFKPGDIITYTIIVNNASSFKATNIKIKDKLDNQTLLPSSFNFYYLKDEGKNVEFTNEKQKLEFTISEMDSQSVCIISYKSKVNEDIDINKEIKNQSVISSDEVKDFKTNSIDLKQKYAKVVCEKSILNDYAYLNTNLTYKIIVKNIGNYEAKDLEIIDQLPETFKLSLDDAVTINNKTISNYFYNEEKCILTIPLDFLDAQEEATILINGSIVK